MQRNMVDWKDSILASEERKAMQIITYPGLYILGKTVLEMVTNGEVQCKSLKALSDRYITVASATLVRALYVEAEAFGSEISYSQNEIPAVTKRLIGSFGSVASIKIPDISRGKTHEHLKAAKLATKNITERPVFGNLDPVVLIKGGPPEIIRSKILELLNKTSSFINFVLSTGCDVPPDTKLENIDAIFDALHEYNEEQLKSIEIYFNSYFTDEIMEGEILCWYDSLSVA